MKRLHYGECIGYFRIDDETEPAHPKLQYAFEDVEEMWVNAYTQAPDEEAFGDEKRGGPYLFLAWCALRAYFQHELEKSLKE